ncbi:MAG TPA: 30S ribosomal protein S6 [Oscillospiraceae bacterium]|nr:30S ribosomal protein S6 [Oscillospiraceae bacterium]HPF56435.1 30S ribosomal protein S6 [Clostridiales bacterium]HPK36565.1 30S ribosomal protein S6 [Oscillospiraceae bacterium]HPR76760.1 30S ribosomal protein S6 [Oscillospiraceae bacterium]
MANYEYVLVIDPEIGEEAVAAMVDKFKTLITDNGEMTAIDEWGKRRLAYKINYKSEGYYVLYTFSTDKMDFVAELERVSKITESVLRWLVVRKDV